jgi:molybdopterin/thiamine biosynthesis adenylyltransferase
MIDRIALQGFDIQKYTAAVIGAGGLGCNIATHLACAGIGKLVLCDFDTVSESNLNRQFLYTHTDIGNEKVTLAAKRLSALAPETQILPVLRKIGTPEDLAFADGADIVFLAVDNNAARRTVQEYCRSKNKPLVNGGVNGFYGTAYLWLPGKTPDLKTAGLLDTENPRVSAISSTVGIIGALEVQLGIKYLLGDAGAAGTLHVLDGEEIHKLRLRFSG